MTVDPVLSLLYLQSDLEAISDEIASLGWRFDPWPVDSLLFYVTMTSKLDNLPWTMRFHAINYREEPPSVLPVNPQTKRHDDPTAWPQCKGFNPITGLCMNITREGLMQLHPEWQKTIHRWKPEGNPIYNVLLTIQTHLDDPKKYTTKPPSQ